jgi:rubrerythrin
VTPELRRSVGEAWAFRARVEHDAAIRFTRLAGAISAFDPDSPAIALMHRAADDERRHAALCEELSAAYGRPSDAAPTAAADIAPHQLQPREAVLYEVIAACCITETESVATLTTLLAEDADPRVRATLHEIARDEVVHGRMGWAHLAREAARRDVSFLAPWVPVMLSGTVDEGLFNVSTPEEDALELLRHGVLPHARKREVFVRTLLDVVFPGLENFGIDAGPARAWLEHRQGMAA